MLISADHLPSNRASKRLDDKWRGPLRVVRKVGEVAYELVLPLMWKGHPIFNESCLKPFTTPTFPGQSLTPT
jgi:hypothetical protein